MTLTLTPNSIPDPDPNPNQVRIVNTSPIEFPLLCSVVPHTVAEDATASRSAVLGGDVGW